MYTSSNPAMLFLDCFAGLGHYSSPWRRNSVDGDRRGLWKISHLHHAKAALEHCRQQGPGKTRRRKYGKPCKPFTLYNAGLYDYKMIKELPWEQYRDFASNFSNAGMISTRFQDWPGRLLGGRTVSWSSLSGTQNAVMDRGFIDESINI